MIQLPRNATVAALALALGVLIGAAGCYYFTSSDPEPQTGLGKLGEMEGQSVLERIRSIAPRDTSGQEEADVEIRYRTDTTTVVDSVYVPIPSSLASTPAISSRSPISVTESRVEWTYFADGRWQQKLYSVPQDNFRVRAYAAVRAHAPYNDVSVGLRRTWAGVGLSLQYGRLEASVSALTTPDFGRQRVSIGLRWTLGEM